MTTPFASGLLDVGDGHRLFYECVGNPSGRPVVWLHGGPGGNITAGTRNLFDPERHYAVLFDQRGCGQSTPSAHEADYPLHLNTTSHLIADIELLREHLGITHWDVTGGSWGAVLGVAYAQAHPSRVSGLVVMLLGDPGREAVQWISDGVGCIFPEGRQRLREAIPARHRRERIIDSVHAWVNDPDPAEHLAASKAWGHWEDTHVSLAHGYVEHPRWSDPILGVRMTRLVTHYWSQDSFLGDSLRTQMPALADVPGRFVVARMDVSSPVGFAYELAQQWPAGGVTMVENEGHAAGDGLDAAFRAALSELG